MHINKKFLPIITLLIAGLLASQGISVVCTGTYVDSCSDIVGQGSCHNHYSGLKNPFHRCKLNPEKDDDNRSDCIDNYQEECEEITK